MRYDKLHVKQHDEKDCGAAALSMILRYWGAYIPLYKLREEIKVDAEGASIYGIIQGAEKHGLIGEALEGDFDELRDAVQQSEIKSPFIARIVTEDGYEHFVTIFETSKNQIIVGDPGNYVKQITWQQFRSQYAGQVICFEKSYNFVKIPRLSFIPPRYKKLVKRYLSELVKAFFISLFLSLLSFIIAITFGYVIGDILSLEIPNVIEAEIQETNTETNKYISVNNRLPIEGIIQDIIHPIEKSFSNLWIAVPTIIIFYFLQGIMSLFRNWILYDMSKNINQDILIDYYKELINLPKNFTDTYKAGEILQRMDDVDNIRSALSGTLLVIFLNSIYLVLGGVILIYISLPLFAMTSIISICYILTIIHFRTPLRNANYEITEATANVMNHLKQTVDGAGTIKSFLLENSFTQKANSLFKKYTHKSFVGTFLGSKQEVVISSIDSCGMILLLTIGTWMIMENKISIGDLITFYFIFGYFSAPIKNLTDLQPMLQSALIAAERLDDIFESTKENKDGDETLITDTTITLDKISFEYAYRNKVLDNISLKIPAKQHIAIIGESGSGKSTLGKLLIRLYPVEKGVIKIGRKNLAHYSLDHLRKQIVYVSNDSYIFRDTLRNNLLMGTERISDRKLIDICNMCCLEKTISRLSNGLDTFMDENGANLSTGERERVNIARALLVKPKILIIDEVTSNLDYNTEYIIMKLLESLKNITCIQITHRLATIKKCDSIVVLKDGKIVEKGQFNELLDLKGEFYSLFKNGQLID